MARRGNSVIGIDLGNHLLKGVLLQRKSDARYVLTSYASREVPENIDSAEDLAQHLKQLLKELGGSTKACSIGVSDPDSLLRIIEQPDTPIELLRNALRLNGLAVLNQECKDFVLDCAPVCATVAEPVHASATANGRSGGNGAANKKYLVGGMLRPGVKQISDAVGKTRLSASILQLAPVCSFNAFEFAYPQIFAKEAFLLLDMGHLQSTVLMGLKKELVLVRSIDYGGKQLTEALTANGALDVNAARVMIEQGDAGMTEICRSSLLRLATEVRNSIGFFEGQHEQSINRIFVSGGLVRSEPVLQALSDELGLPCEIWDPLESCEVALPAAKRQTLANEFASLNVACGAAFEYLKNP
jgi:Tfp pilus assembly PilM family ATPase